MKSAWSKELHYLVKFIVDSELISILRNELLAVWQCLTRLLELTQPASNITKSCNKEGVIGNYRCGNKLLTEGLYESYYSYPCFQ